MAAGTRCRQGPRGGRSPSDHPLSGPAKISGPELMTAAGTSAPLGRTTGEHTRHGREQTMKDGLQEGTPGREQAIASTAIRFMAKSAFRAGRSMPGLRECSQLPECNTSKADIPPRRLKGPDPLRKTLRLVATTAPAAVREPCDSHSSKRGKGSSLRAFTRNRRDPPLSSGRGTEAKRSSADHPYIEETAGARMWKHTCPCPLSHSIQLANFFYGGDEGIRTLETLSGLLP